MIVREMDNTSMSLILKSGLTLKLIAMPHQRTETITNVYNIQALLLIESKSLDEMLLLIREH